MASEAKLRDVLRPQRVDRDFRHQDRLPEDTFSAVKSDHVFNAVELLRTGFKSHHFKSIKDFAVVLDDGMLLPPSAVFCLAASEALGFEVLPKHF